MTTYHTEGIVKDIHLKQNDGSFTLEAEKPYAIEEKNGDKTGKAILFVADMDDAGKLAFIQKGKGGAGKDYQITDIRTAFLAPGDSSFEFSLAGKPIETASLLLLKQNRNKIRITVEGEVLPKAAGEKKFAVSGIDIK